MTAVARRGAARRGTPVTIDPANVALFAAAGAAWWDPDGPHWLLHRMNPVRLGFIRDAAVAHFGLDARSRRPLAGFRALDVGCGGGLVTLPLARMGAEAHGLDAAAAALDAGRAQARVQGLAVRWHAGEVSALATRMAHGFDLVTALEVVEHVTDVPAFLGALRQLLKPGGLIVFSTPNRTAASLAIVKLGAEYVVRAVPRGAHDWRAFLTPAELRRQMAGAGLAMGEVRGISWSPARGFCLSDDLSVGYIGTATAA